MAIRIGIIVVTLLSAVGASAYVLALPSISFRTVSYKAEETALVPPTPTKELMKHVRTPAAVKAIYMSQCYASVPHLRERLLKIADTTEVNSIIVDIKDYTGTISFTPSNPLLVVGGTGCKVRDMRELIADMHKRGIYVIGRITVFQDPFMVEHHKEWAVKRKSNPEAIWKDRKGLGFIDVGARAYWDHVVALARDSHEMGFDELNFDYIRFPSDGNMADALYTHSADKVVNGVRVGKSMAEHVEEFFMYLNAEVKKPYESKYRHVMKKDDRLQMTDDRLNQGGPIADIYEPHVPVTSADLFGMTATNKDDLTIGQVLERALPHFDYVAPMVYPSHYPPGFNGYSDPNKNVYGVIKYSMDKAVARLKEQETDVEALAHTPAYETITVREKNDTGAEVEKTMTQVKKGYYKKAVYPPTKLRTWIQDFDYGGDYGPKEVRDQIQATYDAGLTSWMIWSPSNRYTIEALKVE